LDACLTAWANGANQLVMLAFQRGATVLFRLSASEVALCEIALCELALCELALCELALCNKNVHVNECAEYEPSVSLVYYNTKSSFLFLLNPWIHPYIHP
jgi:hypothetical protein